MLKPDYNVFISWSGARSRYAASALRDWIPKVVQAVEPFMSETDVEKGSRGLHAISTALEAVKLGISCLTPENVEAPWILYEAGALTKTIDDETRLWTYLLGGLRAEDVKPPLGMFQWTKAEKEETRKLVRAINRAVSKKLIPDARLDEIFDSLWPELESKLRQLPPGDGGVEARRPPEEMIAEILEITRDTANRRREADWLDEYVPLFREFMPILQQAVNAAKTAGATAPPVSPKTAGE
jgi:hypothetical protein